MPLRLAITLALGAFALTGRTQTQTVGTFLNTPESYNGYTLLDPMGSTNTHLIDNCGHVINTWTSDYASGGACYLLDDGSLVRGCRVSGAFSGGGVGGRLERRSWDNALLWSLDWADEDKHHHHDFAWMPNGNVLVLAWEVRSAEEAGAAGRINPQTMWPESITEIAPTAPSGGDVVWEWHAWDHLIQNADSTLPQFGDPSEFPGKIDVNFGAVGGSGGPGGASSGDWTHANALAFNPELNQIALSSRRFSEIWILDHNTTSQEAAGPAGDLLYRYGNPEAYGRGTAEDRKFFGQHDVQWLPEGHPQEGQLAVYNNGGDRPECLCSSVDVWEPPLLNNGTYSLLNSAPFGPAAASWTYPETLNLGFFSPNISGVQPQPNGNYLICEGAAGHLFEVTQGGEIVWDYVNPEGNFGVSPQGSTPQQNNVFRAYRYGPDYPGFQGRDMTPGEPLEGASSFACELHQVEDTTSSGTNPLPLPRQLFAYPNPTTGILFVTFPSQGTWAVSHLSGKVAQRGWVSSPSQVSLNLGGLQAGFWLLEFHGTDSSLPLQLRIALN
jgi:hypothetical protein